jgi:hypothetical protein
MKCLKEPLARLAKEKHWLCPIEDRRRLDSGREGMIEGSSLGNYVLLVDYTALLYREGKATLSQSVAAILERLGSSADQWHARLKTLSQGSLLGRFFASTRQRLRDVAARLGLAGAEPGWMSRILTRHPCRQA